MSKSFDRYPHMKHSTAEPWDKTLGDYIARKSKHDSLTAVNNEKKMTFEEWYNTLPATLYPNRGQLALAWRAGQENK